MVERLNRTIKEMLSKYISAHQTDWDKYIDGIVLAYNSTPHETTTISPYRMMFGTEPSLPLDFMTTELTEEEPVRKNNSEYVRNLESELYFVHNLAREVTGKLSQRQKHYYDRNVRNVNYDIGDKVRRNQRQIITGTKAKLARNWTGPWFIVKRLSDTLYQIQHSKNSKPVIVHADNIKPYRGNKQSYPTPESEYTTNETAGGPRRRVPAASERPMTKRLKLPPQPRPETVTAEQSHADSQSKAVIRTTRLGRVIRRPLRYQTDHSPDDL
jgi:hypothetical protein